MNNKIIQVINCSDCPFCNNDNEFGFDCNFPDSKVVEDECNKYQLDKRDNPMPAPNDCPLRQGTVLVSLKK